jgi:hypothetical protein
MRVDQKVGPGQLFAVGHIGEIAEADAITAR